MRAYIIRRLLLVIPTLFVVSLIVFFTIRLIPGDVIDIMLSEQASFSYKDDKEMRAYLEKRLGLDVAAHVQFGRWIKGIVLHGDFGLSLWKETPVAQDILQKLPVSIELGIFGLATALLISFPIGVYSAIRQNSIGDYFGRSFAIACIAVPNFWLGIMAVVFPSIWLDWSPSIFYIHFTEDPLGNLAQFALPGVILGMALCGVNMRMIRTMMLEVLRQDYIRTAWSKGLTERVVILRHTVKNALIPVITLLGVNLPVLVGGTVILEQIFSLPGMGRLLVNAAMVRDYNIISGVVLVITVAVVFINLCVDLIYGALDPRIRYR
jgi:peptide/nickel transport system permease protein